jgi:CheY-like chemotaxis protein
MQSKANVEKTILKNLRALPTEKQQEVLEFTELLRQTLTPQIVISKLSLRQIAAMPLAGRHQHIAPSISKTADDFLTKPELTEFSILDTEDWEDD